MRKQNSTKETQFAALHPCVSLETHEWLADVLLMYGQIMSLIECLVLHHNFPGYDRTPAIFNTSQAWKFQLKRDNM